MRNSGGIILKLTLNKEHREDVDWFHLGSEKRPDVSTCEYGMNSLASTKCRNLISWETINFQGVTYQDGKGGKIKQRKTELL